MNLHHCRRLPLVAAVLLALGFAPVPTPRTGVAEAVVNGFGRDADGVRQTLLAALPRMLQSEKVRGLACLRGERNPSEWVGKRLKAEAVAPGGPVRLRLDGCRPSEALALLTALVNAYETGRTTHGEELVMARQVQLRVQLQVLAAQQVRLAAVQPAGNLPVLVIDEGMARPRGQAVIQRPKLVSDGKGR